MRSAGLEPATSGFVIRRSIQLSYERLDIHGTRPLVRADGLEPSTSPLSGACSTPELRARHGIVRWSGRSDSNRRHRAWKARALPLSYARISITASSANDLERARRFERPTPTLARWCSTPELRPRSQIACRRCNASPDCQRSKDLGRSTGFEPVTSGTTSRRSDQLSYDRHNSFTKTARYGRLRLDLSDGVGCVVLSGGGEIRFHLRRTGQRPSGRPWAHGYARGHRPRMRIPWICRFVFMRVL